MIYKITKYDLLQLPAKKDQIYYVIDYRCLYKDYGDLTHERRQFPALVLNTEHERTHKIRPQNGRHYYVVETNNLWVYDTRWDLKDGDVRSFNAYGYDSNNSMTPVVNTDPEVSSTTGDRILDNNGLLGDGSVVVRDGNRIIKAVAKVDHANNELSVSSYQDNGMTFYPHGLGESSEVRRKTGSLHLGVESVEAGNSNLSIMERKGKAVYYGDLFVVGNIYTMDTVLPSTYQISHTPTEEEKMTHSFLSSKTKQKGDSSYQEFSDVLITVLSETEATVKITTYTNSEENAVRGDDGAILYGGTLVWGSEIVYEASRSVLADDSVLYTLQGTSENIAFSITGSPISAKVEFTPDDFSDDSNSVYAKTELLEVRCLSSMR